MSRTNRDHDGYSCNGLYFLGLSKEDDRGRDRKPGEKPPGWYKRMKRRIRRAKERQALREGKEPPVFRKTDQWDWA